MNGADVNKQSNWGGTAMHFAAQANNIEIVRLLLAFNAQQLKNKQCILHKFRSIYLFLIINIFFSFDSYIDCSRKSSFFFG